MSSSRGRSRGGGRGHRGRRGRHRGGVGDRSGSSGSPLVVVVN